MDISTNPKLTMYRNLYENMGPGADRQLADQDMANSKTMEVKMDLQL